MAYSDKVIDHYNNPRNVGQLATGQGLGGSGHGLGGRAGIAAT